LLQEQAIQKHDAGEAAEEREPGCGRHDHGAGAQHGGRHHRVPAPQLRRSEADQGHHGHGERDGDPRVGEALDAGLDHCVHEGTHRHDRGDLPGGVEGHVSAG
jgi:hypothetical protein